MSAIARAPSSSGTVTDPIRVMVVDDSVVIRGLVGRWLDEDYTIPAEEQDDPEADGPEKN